MVDPDCTDPRVDPSPGAGAPGGRVRRGSGARSAPPRPIRPSSRTPERTPATPPSRTELDARPREGELAAPFAPTTLHAARTPLPRASVILSTYNQPNLLARTLEGYARQSTQEFELIVADDGSGPDTAQLIARHAARMPVRVLHVWQPDDGFHKSRAVNRAVLRSRAPYLIFSDGDCIPSRSFVADHLAAAQVGRYVVGGFVRLSKQATLALACEDVLSGRFETLVSHRDRLKLQILHLKSLLYIALRKRRKPKFYGLNFSVDRESFFRVNGFDDTYHNAGREDSDLRNRMQLAGLGAVSLWSRVGVFHQHHPSHETRLTWRGVAGYYNRESLVPEAPVGLRELQEQERAST